MKNEEPQRKLDASLALLEAMDKELVALKERAAPLLAKIEEATASRRTLQLRIAQLRKLIAE